MSDPGQFLNSSYTEPLEPPKAVLPNQIETWIIDDIYYPKWKKFLALFKDENEGHKNTGFSGGVQFYKPNMDYPTDIDPRLEFQSFIKFQLQQLPINVGQFKKAWGVRYPTGAYSLLHDHILGKQLTAILFLDDCDADINLPYAGNLFTLQPTEDNTIQYRTHPTQAGKMVIMDGRVFHGTYPTLNERKVFVVDFNYNPTPTFD
jgi:hypothetical protein|tara:strand:- start:222 stop:833 length:612 start_codon:yes stop_codon:yes gene_type:complete